MVPVGSSVMRELVFAVNSYHVFAYSELRIQSFFTCYSEPSDQTVRMRQMNLVIAVRACHFVCFVVLLLDCRVR